MDGTMKIETAAMVTPYADTGVVGATTFEAEEIAEILKTLNEEGLDFHVHTVGERSSRVVLDGVEMARKELGDNFRVKVACAHLWIQDDADLERFKKLGVTANYTPVWHSGTIGGRDSLKKIFKFRFWGAGCQHSQPSRPLFFSTHFNRHLTMSDKVLTESSWQSENNGFGGVDL